MEVGSSFAGGRLNYGWSSGLFSESWLTLLAPRIYERNKSSTYPPPRPSVSPASGRFHFWVHSGPEDVLGVLSVVVLEGVVEVIDKAFKPKRIKKKFLRRQA